MEREYGFPADEAFLRGYFTNLISLQPSPSPSLNYYFPYDAGVSAPQIQYAPPMSYHSPYEGGVSAAQFKYAPPMNYQYPCDDGVFASQSQYAPPLNYPSPYDAGVSASLFQFPELPPYGYLEQAPERPQKVPKLESFDSQEFAFQLLNLNAAGVTPEPLINFFSTPDDVTGGKFQHHVVPEEVRSVKMTYSKPESGSRKARRQRISEKTQRLKRLLPWDKKMDTGTMLEETYKYVKFLEAQVSILQAMPVESKSPWNPNSQLYSSLWRDSRSKVEMEEDLRKLDRQQLLQVMVNSPAAQTVLYSRGFCVYSGEQLDHVLQNLADKKAVWEQMMFASPFQFHY